MKGTLLSHTALSKDPCKKAPQNQYAIIVCCIDLDAYCGIPQHSVSLNEAEGKKLEQSHKYLLPLKG